LGKRILVQRRGRGTSTFRAATHKRVAPARYLPLAPVERISTVRGVVKGIIHEPGRGTPLGLIRLETGKEFYTVVPESLAIGQEISLGAAAPVDVGNVIPLGNIPEGTLICNIECAPSDGGKIARSSGAYATVAAHTPEGTIIKLPSGKTTCLSDLCRATVGVIAGAGRIEKPFLKAGEKYHLMVAKGRTYPQVKGVAMIAAYHPFGGGRHKHPGKPVTIARGAPPGRKVGSIAARRAGRGMKKREAKA